jgi:amidase
MSVKGRIASSGFMATLETSKEDGDQVAILRAQGAVFYAKTNQPQGVMHAECNSFWGRTDNPLNLLTSPGGSSGGASALVALKGFASHPVSPTSSSSTLNRSCMALGTDIGMLHAFPGCCV